MLSGILVEYVFHDFIGIKVVLSRVLEHAAVFIREFLVLGSRWSEL